MSDLESSLEAELHHICDAQPFCRCVGRENEWDECCCRRADPDVLATRCVDCGATMSAIDFETGEALVLQ